MSLIKSLRYCIIDTIHVILVAFISFAHKMTKLTIYVPCPANEPWPRSPHERQHQECWRQPLRRCGPQSAAQGPPPGPHHAAAADGRGPGTAAQPCSCGRCCQRCQ